MAFVDIAAREDLENWLTNKPGSWARVVATRAALRAFPHLNNASRKFLALNSDVLFQAITSSWGSLNVPAVKFETKAIATAADTILFILIRSKESVSVQMAGDSIYLASALKDPISGKTVAQAVKSSAEAAASYVYEEPLLEESREFLDAADRYAVIRNIWSAASSDCNWLGSEGNQTQAARRLTCFRLWHFGFSKEWKDNWVDLKGKLLAIDPNYSVWIDWYERRIRGERAAFDIPGDKRRIEDKKILRRLAEATEEDFWGKGHEYVNATLKGWLDEAREWVAPSLITAEVSGIFEITGSATAEVLGTINPDHQDLRSPQFGLGPTGRIEIKADAGSDQLRSDPQSMSRHDRAIEKARRLGEAMRNHNNAGYITDMVGDYAAAMDRGEEGPDPSGLVFAGDQLREAIAKHRAAEADDDLQPLPPSADRDASAFLSAHNMYVGSDPFLDDLDRTTRGPDAPLPSANPDEIMGVVTAARQADIVAEPTYDYIVASSDAAPTIYDPSDRHSRFAAGLAQNFARYGIEFLWAYPTETAWASIAAAGVGAMMTVGLLATGAGAIAGVSIAYHLARNIVANEAVYRKLLATSPAGEDNFNRLIRFLKSSAIKSPKDD